MSAELSRLGQRKVNSELRELNITRPLAETKWAVARGLESDGRNYLASESTLIFQQPFRFF